MKRILPLAVLLLPGAAFAHTGVHSSTFLAGLTHPISGLDHILAMVAVGLWAALTGGRALWALPAAFVSAMVAGGVFASIGLPFPLVEPLILASVIMLGAACALALRPGLFPALTAVAVFGLAHGFAHGTEAPGSAVSLYALGFSLTTVVLHVAGMGLGRSPVFSRILGAVAVLSGLALAIG